MVNPNPFFRDETYRGNQKLKNTGYQRAYSPWELEEIARCSQDPIYFIKKYIRITTADHGVQPFNMWDFQERLIRSFHENRFVIAKLPRQCGKTICTVSYIIWYIIFNEDKNVAILAHKAAASRKILAKLQKSYEDLPDFLKQNIKIWNKGSIELANGTKVVAEATNSASIRGDTQNLVFLDEFAFVQRNIAEEFYESTYPVISSGVTTKIIIASTPKGLNYFYEKYDGAIRGKNEYVPVEIKWNDVPGRDDAWREQQIRNTSEEQFAQEFGAEFLGSSKTLISGVKLLELQQWVSEVEKFTHNEVDTYELPRSNGRYLITVDVSRGLGQDYSAFVVFDVTSYPIKQVAKYRSNTIDPLMFPSVIYSTGLYYNTSHILVEVNDNGQQVADLLQHDLEYENLVMVRKNMKRGGQTVSAGFKKNVTYGLRQTTATKRVGCTNLKSLIEKDMLRINCQDTVEELKRFVHKHDSYSADQGDHDDLVMCCVMLGWLVTQDFFKISIGTNTHDAFRTTYEDEETLPFGIIDDRDYGMYEEEDPEGLIWIPVY